MKKLFTLLVVTTLVLSACFSQGNSSNKGDVEQAATLDEAIANLDGKTITVATSSLGADDPYSEEAAENGPQGSDRRKALYDDFQEKTGVTIEIVELDPAAQVEIVTQSVLAGDPIADLVRVNAGNYETLVRTGMLEDLTNITNLLLNDDRVNKNWGLQIGNILDGYYAIGRDREPRAELLAFDVDLLNKAGMDETPFDLWQRGEWNWTNARAYFMDVKDGLGDDYTVWGDYPSYIRKYGIASAGVVSVEADGTINFTDPGVYEAMSYYKSLYDDGILKFYFDEDGIRDYAQTEEAWTSGKSVFFSMQRWKTQSMAENGKNFGVVPYPIKDDLTEEDVSWPAPSGDVYVVPKGTKNIESAALVAYFYNQFAAIDMPNEGTLDEGDLAVAKRDFAVDGNEEVLKSMRENSIYDPIVAFISGTEDGFDPTTAVTEYIVNGTSLTSAMENGQKEMEANVEKAKENQTAVDDQITEDGSEKK